MAKKVMGRGLGALFENDIEKVFDSPVQEISSDSVVMLKISKVEPNKEQPRKVFDEEKLEVLSESIKIHGVIQPIIVKEAKGGYYQIIAGERRWRASRMAGLKEIPAIIRTYDEMTSMAVALIENLQREDLNPIEEALGYKALLDEFSLTQENVSQRVGKSRSAVANSLRLLALNEEVQNMLSEGLITGGHARAILAVPAEKQTEFANQIVKHGLSVRQAEKLSHTIQDEEKKEEAENNKTEKNIALEMQIKEIQTRLASSLGTKVKITDGDKKGKIEIEYYGREDFERLLNLLNL